MLQSINLVGNTTQGQNIGSGCEIYKGKNGGNVLQFKSLSATGSSIQLFSSSDTIYISGATGKVPSRYKACYWKNGIRTDLPN